MIRPLTAVIKQSFGRLTSNPFCALQTFHLNTTSHLSPSQPAVLNDAARKNVELLQVIH